MTELTGRSPMKSPGAPCWRRELEREFWREIRKGLLPREAAAAVGVSQPVGSRWFRHGGGMPSIELAPLSGRYLSFAEREEVAILTAQGAGVREIARQLERAPSTVSRELRRNAATRGGKLDYRASVAQWKADLVARRPKTAKLVANDRLREYVQERLAGDVCTVDGTPVPGPNTLWKGLNKPHRGDRRWAQGWSPEQISHRLRVDFPDDTSMRISHEAIYQSLLGLPRVRLTLGVRRRSPSAWCCGGSSRTRRGSVCRGLLVVGGGGRSARSRSRSRGVVRREWPSACDSGRSSAAG